MADKKISELEAANSIQEGCCFPLVTENQTKKISFGTIVTALRNIFAAKSDLTSHTGNTSNPHGVTAAQVGAATSAELNAEKSARETTDARIINGGAKNRCPIASGESTAPTKWFDITGMNVAAGNYVFSFDSMESTDTDDNRCRGVFYDENGGRASEYFYIPRGDNVHVNVTVTATAKSIRINPSSTLDGSTGDTLSFTGAMLCSADDWALSHDYVPYCPTLAELYSMIRENQS